MKNNTIKNQLAVYILVVGVIISLIIGYQRYKNLDEKDQFKFETVSKKTVQNIKDRMDTYREVLYSGIGLFKAFPENVTRDSWHIFVKELQLSKYYPGIQGVGYSAVLYENDLAKNIKQIRSEGFKDYKIYPEGKREFYTSIIYLEPFDWRNQRAFGYDMYSNEIRRIAMKRAIETTEPSLSGKVRLVQENGKDEQAGFLLYLPLYKYGLPLNTIEDRYKAIKGFVYSPFRAKDFMLGVVNDSLDFVQLKVYDGELISEETLLFTSKDGKTLERLKYINLIEMDGHLWCVEITALDSFVNGDNLAESLIFTLIGLIITFLLFNIARYQNRVLKLKDDALYRVSQGIVITDKNRNIIYVNKGFEEITGYSSEFLMGKNPNILQGEETDKKTITEIKRNLDLARPFVSEILNYKKDGTKFWNRMSVTPIFDTYNKLERFIGIQDDVTEKVIIQKKVLEQKVEFETIFEYSKDGIAIMDLESNFLTFNEAYKELTGYSKEELSKLSYLAITVPEDFERSKKMIDKVVEVGSVKNFEKSYIVKDGHRIRVNCSISLLPDKKRLLIVAKDMTSLKIVEEQSKLISMGEMIGNIAHQWRQPLSIITTSASAIQLHKELNTLDDKRLLNSMALIVKEAKFLSKTIDDFKNFIKGSETFANCGIKDIVDETLLLMNASLKNHYIDLIVDLKDDGIIFANKGQIVQALINILNNAKDALNEQGNDENNYIFITSNKISSDKIRLEICDTGKGIDEDIIDRVFEPYFTTKHQSTGTGIGLNMTYKILVDNHSFSVDAYNKEFPYNEKFFRGACFSIEFNTIDSKKEDR